MTAHLALIFLRAFAITSAGIGALFLLAWGVGSWLGWEAP